MLFIQTMREPPMARLIKQEVNVSVQVGTEVLDVAMGMKFLSHTSHKQPDHFQILRTRFSSTLDSSFFATNRFFQSSRV
jgi:hypothetical protein